MIRLSDMIKCCPPTGGCIGHVGTRVNSFSGTSELTAILETPCIIHNISTTGGESVTVNIDDSLIETFSTDTRVRSYLIGLDKKANGTAIYYCNNRYNASRAVYEFYVRKFISCSVSKPGKNIHIKYIFTKEME